MSDKDFDALPSLSDIESSDGLQHGAPVYSTREIDLKPPINIENEILAIESRLTSS
ncbi:MAG: hypothetical protein OXG15_05425 [Gammaproteobacteria bacterium]|nr:hypothetical protein [Gammaproteobacteria bacterium]